MSFIRSEKLHTAYLTNKVKENFDDDNSRYDKGTRYKTNSKVGYGTRRQFSWNRKESGMSLATSAAMVLLDFIVTYHTEFPYQTRYHGAQMIVSGEFSVEQMVAIVEHLNDRFAIATQTLHGVNVTIEVVKLRRGKKTREQIVRTNEGKLVVLPRLKAYENKPKVYRRNRKALS